MKKSVMLFVTLLFVGISTAKDVHEILNEFLKKPVTLSYDLSVYWAIREIEETHNGLLTLDEPNSSFKFQTGKDTWVSDGVTVWQFNEDTKQCIITDLIDFDQSMHPSGFLKRFEGYTFESAGKKDKLDAFKWQVEPGVRDEYKEISVFLEKKSEAVKKIVLIDRDDNISTYLFNSIEFSEQFEETMFQYEVPEGADVFDRR